MSNDIESVQTFIPALLQIGERMKQDSDRIATLEQQLRDREAELLRVRTHETAAAHELDVKLTPEERHSSGTLVRCLWISKNDKFKSHHAYEYTRPSVVTAKRGGDAQ